MNKTLLIILSIVCFATSAVMYYVGSTSSNLSELMDFFYVPLPLGLIAIISAFKKKK